VPRENLGLFKIEACQCKQECECYVEPMEECAAFQARKHGAEAAYTIACNSCKAVTWSVRRFCLRCEQDKLTKRGQGKHC